MKLLQRYLGQIAVTENAQVTFDLPRNYVYSALRFCLVAQMDRAGGAAGTCRDSAPAQLVKRLEVVLDGKNTIKNMDLETLHRANQFRHGVRPEIYAHDLLGFADFSDKVFTVCAQFDFERPRNGPARNRTDTCIDARGLSDFDLVVTFGAKGDVLNGTSDGAMTLDSAKLLIFAVERVGAPIVARPIWKESVKEVDVNAAGEMDIDLPVNTAYDELFIKTVSDTNLVDTIIPFGISSLNEVQLFSGTEQFLRLPGGLLQRAGRIDYQTEAPERIGSAAALNHAQQELTVEGYYPIQFVRDGLLTEALDASHLSDLKLRVNAAHPGTTDKIFVIKSEILMPMTPEAA